MNIWIFNHHAVTPDMSGGTRHFDFAKELIKQGNKVTIIASSFHYSKYKELKTYNNSNYLYEQIGGVDFIWIKTRPYSGNGVGRVFNMLDYMYKALHVKIDTKPDIIIGSSVHLFAVYAAYKMAKKLDVPFVMEVRDIWPQTLIDMGISSWHPFILLLGYLEKFLYKKATKIISLLPLAHKHIEKFGIEKEKIIWISNGVDIERSQNIRAFQFEAKQFHITYAGAIGQANQLQTLIEAASAIKDSTVLFHIIGDGPLKLELENIKTPNVIFHGSVSKQKAIAMINGSDVLFFPLADSPVFKFGISSNKLFDYLASKKPIIFASNSQNNPVKEANAGISIPAEDAVELIKSIEILKLMSQEKRNILGENGFNYVQKHHSITHLAAKFKLCLSSIVYTSQKKKNL